MLVRKPLNIVTSFIVGTFRLPYDIEIIEDIMNVTKPEYYVIHKTHLKS